MSGVLSVLLPILVGGVATWLADKAQVLWAVVDRLPALVKRIGVGAISWVLAWLTTKGVALSGTDPTALGAGDYSALLSALLAFVFHLGSSIKAAGALTAARRR